MERLQEISQIDESFGQNMESKTDSQDVDWIEVRLKRASNLVLNPGKVSGKAKLDLISQNQVNRDAKLETQQIFRQS